MIIKIPTRAQLGILMIPKADGALLSQHVKSYLN